MAVKYGSLPFREQITFFLAKLNVPTRAWTDVWRDAHDTSFMVAGAYKAELLADFREAVRKGIEDGTTIQTFRKDFDTIVAKHGWTYKGARGWRTRVIYETNLRTSYQAGRHAQLTDPDLLQSSPYWRYKHSDSVRFPREQHLAWNGLVLRHDDPWWQAHFPPNGWGCKCRVYSESDRTLRKLGKPGPDSAPAVEYETRTVGTRGQSPRTVSVPKGIDPGWDYAPGRTVASHVREQIRQRIPALQQPIGQQLGKAIEDIPAPPPASPMPEPAFRPGYKILYRGTETGTGKGRWYTDDREYAARFGPVHAIQVPYEIARQAMDKARRQLSVHYILPDDYTPPGDE